MEKESDEKVTPKTADVDEPEINMPPIKADQIGMYYFDVKTQTFWAGIKVHAVNEHVADLYWDAQKLQLGFLYDQIARQKAEREALAGAGGPKPKDGIGGMMKRLIRPH